MIIFGFILGVATPIVFYYFIKSKNIKNIEAFFKAIFDKMKPTPLPKVTSYGYNTKSKIMTLEYDNDTKEEYYRDFVTWRTIPEMREVSYDMSNFINRFKVRIEFESKNGTTI